MTNPQKENGYTPICNELLEAIYSSPFNATQLKILMVVCRYTYGFSRKEHSISESFISKAVNISKRYISSELNKLVEQKVITIVKAHTDTASRVLSLNKHYDEWICKIVQQVNNTSTGEQLINTTVEQYITTPVEQLFHQDKQNLKQNLKQHIPIKKLDFKLTPIQQTIEDFKDMRKSGKKPITPRGLEMMLKKLDGMADTDEKKIEILEQSIMNSWHGIFELKGSSKIQANNDWRNF